MSAPIDNTASPAVRFGDWIAEGWRMFVEQWKGWVVNILVVLLAIMAPSIPFFIILFGLIVAARNSQTPELPLLIWPVTFIFVIVVGVIGMLLAGGLYSSAMNQ